MRFNNFAQHNLDSLWDELEDAEDRLKEERQRVPFDQDAYALAAEEVTRLRRAYRDFDGT